MIRTNIPTNTNQKVLRSCIFEKAKSGTNVKIANVSQVNSGPIMMNPIQRKIFLADFILHI